MKIHIKLNKYKYELDLEKNFDISIPYNFNGSQPNFYGVNKASVSPLKLNDTIWSVLDNGPCNVPEISLNIHCNGTHSESVGHLLKEKNNIGKIIKDIFIPIILISVEPEYYSKKVELYHTVPNKKDLIITSDLIKDKLRNYINSDIRGIVVRTLPNNENKLKYLYPKKEYPFFSNNALSYFNDLNIKHLFVDTPSIDRYDDDGILGNHRLFWGDGKNINSKLDKKSQKTITEFCYINNKIEDGLYFINLQIPHFMLDSAPSRPILIKTNRV